MNIKTQILSVTQTVAITALMLTGLAVAENQPKKNNFWWPDKLDLTPLRQHAAESNPMGDDFNYAKAFRSIDIKLLKKDIIEVMNTSQDWWPADY